MLAASLLSPIAPAPVASAPEGWPSVEGEFALLLANARGAVAGASATSTRLDASGATGEADSKGAEARPSAEASAKPGPAPLTQPPESEGLPELRPTAAEAPSPQAGASISLVVDARVEPAAPPADADPPSAEAAGGAQDQAWPIALPPLAALERPSPPETPRVSAGQVAPAPPANRAPQGVLAPLEGLERATSAAPAEGMVTSPPVTPSPEVIEPIVCFDPHAPMKAKAPPPPVQPLEETAAAAEPVEAEATPSTTRASPPQSPPLVEGVRPGPVTMPAEGLAKAEPQPLTQPVEGPPTEPGAGQPVTEARESALSTLSRAAIDTTAAIAAQVLRTLEGRSTRFEMALTPEELGRVDVSLEIDADGQLAARLAFDNPAAAVELRGRADELRRQLEDAGFRLGQDSLQFSDREPSERRQSFAEQARRAFAGAGRVSDEADPAGPAAAARYLALSLNPDRLDLRI